MIVYVWVTLHKHDTCMSFEIDGRTFKLQHLLYLHVLYYTPKEKCFIYQSVDQNYKYMCICLYNWIILHMNYSHKRCIFSLSWFDASLFTTRINKGSHKIMIMRTCNAHAISSCIIAFDIVKRLQCSLEGGLSSNKIASRLCNINLKTDGRIKPHRWEIVVTTRLLNNDHNSGVHM